LFSLPSVLDSGADKPDDVTEDVVSAPAKEARAGQSADFLEVSQNLNRDLGWRRIVL
jgi:hypothetical protein